MSHWIARKFDETSFFLYTVLCLIHQSWRNDIHGKTYIHTRRTVGYVLDLARHSTLAPDGKRYVVATFDDTRLQNGYVTDVYPQQYDYLTLVQLGVAHYSSATPEEAIKKHLAVIQDIQQGKLTEQSLTI
jgi:hypothetical protein